MTHRPTLLLAGFFAVACIVRTSAATLEERVQLLEERLATLTQENAALKKQLTPDTKAKPAAPATVVVQGKETKLAIGGFMQLNAETGDAADSRFPDNDRFLLRKIRLGVKGSFSDTLDFTLQADFGANSLAATSAYRVQATDVNVLWKAHPSFNVTFGQFKTPFGYEQIQSDTKIPTIERALASDSLTLGRQAGAMVAGIIGDKKFTYATSITNGLSANNSGNDNEQFAFTGRLAATVVDIAPARLSLGLNGFTTRDTGTFTGRREGAGVDAQLVLGRVEINAEYLSARFDRDTGADYRADGWSVSSVWTVVPNRWQVFARYETYDPSSIARADSTDMTTLGFNYLIKGDDLKLSVNYLIGEPPGAPHHLDRLIGRLQVVF